MRFTQTVGVGDDSFNTFFSETGAGKHVPRSADFSANSRQKKSCILCFYESVSKYTLFNKVYIFDKLSLSSGMVIVRTQADSKNILTFLNNIFLCF
jgi:hypothetical protein